MTEQRTQWRGSASSPLVLTLDRPQQAQVDTGYDVEIDAPRPARATRCQQTPNVPQPRQAVTRPRQGDTPASMRSTLVPVAPTQHLPCPQEQDNKSQTKRLTLSRPQTPTLHFHWLPSMGVGMLAVLLVWLTGTALVNWWQGGQDAGSTRQPPTFQCDAKVGHNDAHTPSHFLVLTLNNHVEVVEFPGGDTTKVLVYHGPLLLGQTSPHDPATVSFKDVNRDGKLDLLLTVGPVKYVYLNDTGAFRPLRADDHVQME